MNTTIRNICKAALSPLIALLFAFALGSVVILLIGENPFTVYATLFQGAFGGIEKVAGTLLQTTPIIIAGIAACLAFKSGVFNIGIEGQLYMGGFAAALVGFSVQLPRAIHLPLAILASALAGMLWVSVPAYFRSRHNTNEVVSTILLNYVAVLLTSYFTIFLFKKPGGWSETPQIFETAHLPQLFSFSRLNVGFIAAIALAIGLKIYMERTSSGYETATVGANPEFARYGGVDVKNRILWVMLVSGAVGGLAGGIETLGVHHRFMDGFAPGFGFDGITAALLANANPIGTIFTAFFFGALRSGSLLMEVQTQVSREVITVLQALVILFVSVKMVIGKRRSRKGAQKEVKS